MVYHLLQGNLQVVPVCDGHQVAFPVQIFQQQGPGTWELFPHCVLQLCVGRLQQQRPVSVQPRIVLSVIQIAPV